MEKRQSFRYPTTPDRQPANIQVKGRACPAVLLDESAGGFRISVPKDEIQCQPDLEIQLQTYRGWHDALVVRQLDREDETEYGLLRLRDYHDEQTFRKSHSKTRYFRMSGGGIGGEYLIGLAIIFLVPLAPVLFQQFLSATPVVEGEAEEGVESPSLFQANPPPPSKNLTLKRQAKPLRMRSATAVRRIRSSTPTESKGGEPSVVASMIGTGINRLGSAAGQAFELGASSGLSLFNQTERLVHECLEKLSPSDYRELRMVVTEYKRDPSSEHLRGVESLLHHPAYESLEELVEEGKVSSTRELAQILTREF